MAKAGKRRMKRKGYLFPNIWRFDNLLTAVRNASRGKKKKSRVLQFLFEQEYELVALQRELQEKIYIPRPYQIFQIEDPKPRQICAPDFRDRVVQHAICQVIGPCLERGFIDDSYACRKGKGHHRAIQRASEFCRRFPYFLKCDVRKFFYSIDHTILTSLLVRKFKDTDAMWLFNTIIHTAPTETPGKSIPLGNLTSQYFANLYLDPLDHLLKENLRLKGYVRYMDDFLMFGEKEQLHQIQEELLEFLHLCLRLELKSQATLLAPCWQGIPFLGFRVFPGVIKIKRENWRRFQKKFQKRQRQFASREIDASDFTRSIASLIGYLRHGDTWWLRKQFFGQYTQDF